MIEIVVLIIVIFIYIQIISHYKSTNDLDIFEVDYLDNINMQEICNMRQPFVFSYSDIFPKLQDIVILDTSQSMILYDKKDYAHPLQVPFSTAQDLLVREKYYSETTGDFLQPLDALESFFKPSFTVFTEYSMLQGSIECSTPFTYHTCYRRFLFIQQGEICLKMAPWKKNKKHLYEIYDSFLGKTRSLMDVWNPSPPYSKYWKNIEFVEITAKEGQVVYIPPHWGYSIQYRSSPNLIYEISYHTFFNYLAFYHRTIYGWFRNKTHCYVVRKEVAEHTQPDIYKTDIENMTKKEEVIDIEKSESDANHESQNILI